MGKCETCLGRESASQAVIMCITQIAPDSKFDIVSIAIGCGSCQPCYPCLIRCRSLFHQYGILLQQPLILPFLPCWFHHDHPEHSMPSQHSPSDFKSFWSSRPDAQCLCSNPIHSASITLHGLPTAVRQPPDCFQRPNHRFWDRPNPRHLHHVDETQLAHTIAQCY
jgi:hypothetical protein